MQNSLSLGVYVGRFFLLQSTDTGRHSSMNVPYRRVSGIFIHLFCGLSKIKNHSCVIPVQVVTIERLIYQVTLITVICLAAEATVRNFIRIIKVSECCVKLNVMALCWARVISSSTHSQSLIAG